MAELVEDEEVVASGDGGERADGGGVTRGEGEGGFRVFELGEGVFEIGVWWGRAGDEPGGTGASAVGGDGFEEEVAEFG